MQHIIVSAFLRAWRSWLGLYRSVEDSDKAVEVRGACTAGRGTVRKRNSWCARTGIFVSVFSGGRLVYWLYFKRLF